MSTRFVATLFLLGFSSRVVLALSVEEAATAQACMAYAEAQEIFRRTDYDGDGVLEYAQALTGKDSLFERAPGAGDLALIDESIGKADATSEKPTARLGYLFKILKAQGDKAAGGKRSYISQGNMVLGYALIAYPEKYENDTRHTFVINNNGTVFYKDLGEKTADLAAAMTEFNPDETWKEADVAGLVQQAKEAHKKDRAESPIGKALAELAQNPGDTYLQYVALQLAWRTNKREIENVASQIEASTRNPRANRRESLDAFSLFSGALAVQEALQLDTMRARAGIQRGFPAEKPDPAKVIAVDSLKPPEIKSHPWATMLKGRKPDVSVLSKLVPEDMYLAEFNSLNNLIDAMETSDLWGTHLFNQAAQEARTHQTGARLKQQLAIETNALMRPIYDVVVEKVAVVGSDLYLREGSDVTLLFKIKQPDLFKARMAGFIANAEKIFPDAKRDKGTYLDVEYEQLTTPEREVNVFAAYPLPDIHVRSNSIAGLRRVIEGIKGVDANGKSVKRLGESQEFQYVRTLMPLGDKVEDGFVYLSDPFIRTLIGARVKLTEKHRMQCYNHLRMIGHAALLYRTEKGKAAASLAEIADAKCSPGKFNEGELVCPDAGTYTLSHDGSFGVCSCHGHAHYLVPCCEIPVTKVSKSEAEEYNQFVREYSQYWRTFFDPIALRLQITPQRYRIETLILPLIDNSIYTQLAAAMAGETAALDAAPVLKRNICSVAFKLNKSLLTKQELTLFWMLATEAAKETNLPFKEFLSNGIGDNIALHVCDSAPLFDFNLTRFIGEMMGSVNRGLGRDMEAAYFTVLLTALNAPVYVSVAVQDEKVTDTFLEKLDEFLAIASRRNDRGGWIEIDQDFYKLQTPPREGKAAPAVHAYGFRFGPIKWRFFWARIGGFLYVASQPGILEELAALDSAPKAAAEEEAESKAHGLLTIRPTHWALVLPDYRLGWAENNREACLNNLSMLSGVAKAYGTELAQKPANEASRLLRKQADRLHAVHFFCPDGGQYVLAPDGKSVVCSAHHSVLKPQQKAAPNANTPTNALMQSISNVTVSLTFLEDGLRAVLTVERK
ncbi:MAG TPA: DUF2950 family protein [Planctomycetota bacterium]|nr:DUF2950 family protein [Planctomycetota bacterium]